MKDTTLMMGDRAHSKKVEKKFLKNLANSNIFCNFASQLKNNRVLTNKQQEL